MNERPLEESIRALLRSAAPRELPPHLLDRVSTIPSAVVIGARRPRLQWGYGGAFAVLATLIVIASAVLIAPRATSLFGGATVAPKPSPTAAGSSDNGPVTICGDLPHSYKGLFIPFLGCSEAISTALGSLPKEHAEIAQIEFGFGGYCRPTAACPTGIDLLDGYVLVTYATGPRSLILVRDESAQSGVSVTSTELLP
jgi:hypothetical protein